MYDYLNAIMDDVREAIRNDYNVEEWTENRDEFEEQLNDDLWIDDSVTGNASGSYTFNSYTAREYVLDNMDILNDMISEWCMESADVAARFINEEWKWFDVSIRCYLLGQAISEVLDEMEEAGAFDAPEEADDVEEAA